MSRDCGNYSREINHIWNRFQGFAEEACSERMSVPVKWERGAPRTPSCATFQGSQSISGRPYLSNEEQPDLRAFVSPLSEKDFFCQCAQLCAVLSVGASQKSVNGTDTI